MKKPIYTLAFMLILFSCKKSKSNCETWEYYDQCVCLNPTLFGCGYDCNDGPVLQGKFCGDDLVTIHADSSKVLPFSQDSHSKTIRHFLRKIN